MAVPAIRTEPVSAPDVAVAEHPFSQMVCTAFARGCGGDLVRPEIAGPNVATYGILRGCGEAMQRAENFYYIDHGFFERSDPANGDGYYRVMHNRMWPASTDDGDSARFDALNVPMKDMRQTGSHIIVAPPSDAMSRFLGLGGWLERTISSLHAMTDRPTIVSEKGVNNGITLLAGAWCVVTEHSQLAIDALLEGVPAIMLSPERRLGTLADIENPPMDRSFFSRLANSQFTLAEMASGECWEHLHR